MLSLPQRAFTMQANTLMVNSTAWAAHTATPPTVKSIVKSSVDLKWYSQTLPVLY